jgi:hypothetical protein
VYTTKAFFTYVWTLSAAEAGESILQMIHIIPSPLPKHKFSHHFSQIMLQSTNGRLGQEQNDKRSKDPSTWYSYALL